MKPFVLPSITATLLGAGIAATWLFGRHAKSNAAPADAGPTMAALQDEVERLRRDVSAVKDTAHGSARQPSLAASSSLGGRQPVTPEERKEQAQSARAAWYAKIDSQFSSERRDPAWSSDATRSFETMLANHASHASLVSADCASTMCKIVVNHQSPEMQKEFSLAITEEPLLEAEVMYKYDAETQPPTTTMWVSRTGHRLPRVAWK
jgi:hypothetical protein